MENKAERHYTVLKIDVDSLDSISNGLYENKDVCLTKLFHLIDSLRQNKKNYRMIIEKIDGKYYLYEKITGYFSTEKKLKYVISLLEIVKK